MVNGPILSSSSKASSTSSWEPSDFPLYFVVICAIGGTAAFSSELFACYSGSCVQHVPHSEKKFGEAHDDVGVFHGISVDRGLILMTWCQDLVLLCEIPCYLACVVFAGSVSYDTSWT